MADGCTGAIPERKTHAPYPMRTAAGTVCVADLRAFLLGDWRILRRLRDRRLGLDGRFEGIGRFIPDGPSLRYEETGLLRFGAHEGEATQSHLYHFPTPGSAAVHFRDGRFFHPLDLTDGADRVRHDCPPDLYGARFRVPDPNTWTVAWRVRGPRKILTIAGIYRRAGGSDDP